LVQKLVDSRRGIDYKTGLIRMSASGGKKRHIRRQREKGKGVNDEGELYKTVRETRGGLGVGGGGGKRKILTKNDPHLSGTPLFEWPVERDSSWRDQTKERRRGIRGFAMARYKEERVSKEKSPRKRGENHRLKKKPHKPFYLQMN